MATPKPNSSPMQEESKRLAWSRRQQWLNLCGAISSLYLVVDLGEHFVNYCLLQEQPFYRIFMKGTGLLFWVIVLVYYVRLLFFKCKAQTDQSVTK